MSHKDLSFFAFVIIHIDSYVLQYKELHEEMPYQAVSRQNYNYPEYNKIAQNVSESVF